MPIITYKKTYSFGVGITPEGNSQFIWVLSGKEIDAMIYLFSLGWKEASFPFEGCEFIE